MNIDLSRPQIPAGAGAPDGGSWLCDREADGESIELERVSEYIEEYLDGCVGFIEPDMYSFVASSRFQLFRFRIDTEDSVSQLSVTAWKFTKVSSCSGSKFIIYLEGYYVGYRIVY